MIYKRIVFLTICLKQTTISFSYEKNSPDDPLVIDHERDIENAVKLTSMPLLMNSPLSKNEQWWNIPSSEKEIYRQVAISYMGKRLDNIDPTLTVVKILPGDPFSSNLYSKKECQYFSTELLSTYVNNDSWEFSHAIRLWKDLNEGIIGFENQKKIIAFIRIVCLPKNIIDDIDMVGIDYAYPTNIINNNDLNSLKTGKALYVSIDDPRKSFRYDPTHFFDRLEKYGVTPQFKVPKTENQEGWQNNKWNISIKIFPLSDSFEIQD